MNHGSSIIFSSILYVLFNQIHNLNSKYFVRQENESEIHFQAVLGASTKLI